MIPLLLAALACTSPPDTQRRPLQGSSPSTPSPSTVPAPAPTPAPTTSPPPADLVLVEGHVLTMDSTLPVATALAVTDGSIVYVGDDLGVQAYIGATTQVTELDGLTVLPGLHDSHIHLLEAFHPAAGTCIVPTYVPLFRLVDDIAACAPDQIGTE